MLRLDGIVSEVPGFKLGPISLELGRGERLAIVGPTGSGKTMTMEIIAGVRRATAGKIFLDGEDITLTPPWRRNISMLYQHLALFPHLSVIDNIAYPLRWTGIPKEERYKKAKEIATRLGISHLLPRRIHGLSGGERQRVALARALITRPKLLMLDEPTSAIDPVTKEDVTTSIREIYEKFPDMATIIITHSPLEAYTLADKILILRSGKVIKIGNKDEIWHNPEDRWFARMIGYRNILGISERGEGWIVAGGIRLAVGVKEEYDAVAIHPTAFKTQEEGIFFRGRVRHIEKLPDIFSVHLQLPQAEIVWHTPNPPVRGEELTLWVNPKNIKPIRRESI